MAGLPLDLLLPGHLRAAVGGGQIHIPVALDYLDPMALLPNIP